MKGEEGLEEAFFPGESPEELRRRAEETRRESRGERVELAALLAAGNICRNRCTYCGLRAPNQHIRRYRLAGREMAEALKGVREQGIPRVFLISGEDPGFPEEELLAAVEAAGDEGLDVILGMGDFSLDRWRRLKAAGAAAGALKFESSSREILEAVKPDVSFDDRMAAVRRVPAAGLALASGNLVGLPGETEGDLIRDIRLTAELDVFWAPVVPYLPAPHTPLAEAGTPMGSVDRLLREIALLRLLMPEILITAGQPAQDSTLGFADPAGSRAALQAGADLFFVDITPRGVREDFSITPKRILPRLQQIDGTIEPLGLRRP